MRPLALCLGLCALFLSACHHSAATCPPNPEYGIYHPSRLHILKTCVTYTGTVSAVRLQPDGDHHVLVKPDPDERHFLTGRNYSAEGGALVVEIVLGQKLPIPAVGDRVDFVGNWQYDTDHRWNELHPVFCENDRCVLPPNPPLYP